MNRRTSRLLAGCFFAALATACSSEGATQDLADAVPSSTSEAAIPTQSSTAPPSQASEPVPVAAVSVLHPVRRIDGLENVENSLYALGSVWAVTSNRPDEYSSQTIEATVVRIDPATDRVEEVLDSPGVEPTFAELDGKIWVKLVDRIVAIDATGSETASIPFEPGSLGDQVAGLEHLWILDFAGGNVSAIDPRSASVVRTIKTGGFPSGPVAAFGHIWILSLTDGTVTIIDEETLGDNTLITSAFSDAQLKSATAVPHGVSGNEVWVTNIDGDVFAITAEGDAFGQVRQVAIDVAINRVFVHDGRAFLLPIWGTAVHVLDLETEELVTRIPTEAIPYKAAVVEDLFWVAGDGMQEILTVIDPQSAVVVGQFPVGSNLSNTNGPHQPLSVGHEIWVPNRGDDAFFIVTINNA